MLILRKHKKKCEKHAAKLHDEALLKEPPPPEECPICFLPLPLDSGLSQFKACCGKTICSGCIHAVEKRDGGVGICPFCRTPGPTAEESAEQIKKRMELGDAHAIYDLGVCYSDGDNGISQDHAKAVELWHRAGELGYAPSYHNIGNAYYNGDGEERDEKKANHYFELAAMGGGVEARYNLGMYEACAGNMDRAVKHHMIAVGSGCTDSLEKIKQMFMNGYATKGDYTKVLQTYQAYLGEIKSPQRDEAAAAFEDNKYY